MDDENEDVMGGTKNNDLENEGLDCIHKVKVTLVVAHVPNTRRRNRKNHDEMVDVDLTWKDVLLRQRQHQHLNVGGTYSFDVAMVCPYRHHCHCHVFQVSRRKKVVHRIQRKIRTKSMDWIDAVVVQHVEDVLHENVHVEEDRRKGDEDGEMDDVHNIHGAIAEDIHVEVDAPLDLPGADDGVHNRIRQNADVVLRNFHADCDFHRVE